MKRRSLLAMILSLVMCLGIAMPAWAAEGVTDTLDVMEIMDSVEFEAMEIQSIEQVDESAGVQKFTVDTADDTIDVYADNVNVSKQMIEEYLNRAAYAIAQENAVALYSEDTVVNDVIQYIYTDGINEVRYVEGMSEDGEYVKDMVITKAEQIENSVAGVSLLATDPIPDGIGIRGKVKQDGQYISGSFVNCKPVNYNELQNSKFSYYQYFGFLTTVGESNAKHANADMGVVYSETRGGWRPYLKLIQGAGSAKKTYMISKEPNQSGITTVGTQVWDIGESAYKTDAPVYITVYKTAGKYDSSKVGTAVRLSVRGTSVFDGSSNVLCVAEAGTGVDIAVNYRVLSTITDYDNGKEGAENIHITVPASSNASAPRMPMNYSGLKVGATDVTWIDTEPDSSKVTKATTGKIIGEVNAK